MFHRLLFKPDRRRRTRHLLGSSVRVFTAGGVIDALGVNVSEVGMCLFTVANLPVGSEIQIELPLENAGVKRMRAVIRFRALYLYGIEFERGSGHSADISSVDLKTSPSPDPLRIE